MKGSFKPSTKIRKKNEEIEKTLIILEAGKLMMFYALRNEGWGHKRLSRLNAKCNGYMNDINNDLFSIMDIRRVLADEVNLTVDDLKLRPEK